jgi:hypothetical protein
LLFLQYYCQLYTHTAPVSIGTAAAIEIFVGNELTETDETKMTKTTTSSYGQATRYTVLKALALAELREQCECRTHGSPCASCADRASDIAWAQLTDDERALEQTAQKAAHPIPESQRLW